jgi:hypothetical protein
MPELDDQPTLSKPRPLESLPIRFRASKATRKEKHHHMT